ncbi:pseudouridine synthase [Thalassoglobus sp. JC818]|uniref:pseudouridine synthase n=1 Tax=Thalassoglobus sp. JC818 TaxID=3232136 RepID=UPI003457C59A
MSQPADDNPVVPGMRLQRYLAQCGLGSRRECEELISAGRVEVDGKTVTKLGANVRPSMQTVTLDGEKLKLERKKYYLLNKPPGFLCTASDPQGRPTVFELFPPDGPRLFSVGRLDENTTGLLIVTNDGDLAQKLAHPRYHIHRIYRAQVAGHPKREVFEQLKEGLFFTEGKFKVHNIKPIKKQGRSSWVEITMTEGQNREVRRLLARTGHKVMKLERIGFGPIRIGRVPLGQFRELRKDELGKLIEIVTRAQTQSPRQTKKRPGKKAAPGRSGASGKAKSRGRASASSEFGTSENSRTNKAPAKKRPRSGGPSRGKGRGSRGPKRP